MNERTAPAPWIEYAFSVLGVLCFDFFFVPPRIRVALRRAERAGGEAEPVYEYGDLKVDLARRKVWLGKKDARLTPPQSSLPAVLVRNAGRRLMKELWPDGDGAPESVRLLVRQIRHRLERDPARPKHFKTEPGVGYRLEDAAS